MTDFQAREKPPRTEKSAGREISTKAPVVIVTGPTASGKSGLAMALAEELDGTIINADSMQIYRDLRVVTARPDEADEARVPHRLFGVLDAAERCSVGRWLDLAVAAIEETRKEGRLPIMVGGTGMYLKALTEGLAPVPDVPEAVTEQASDLYDELGGEGFRDKLAALDPDAAKTLPPGDRQRLIRAFAVVTATGKTLSEWQSSAAAKLPVAARFVTILVMPERADIYEACDRRFGAMLDAGAMDEVSAMLARGLDPALPAMRAVGVPELGAVMRGEMSLEQAGDKARQATRNYAKRQITWSRHQLSPDLTLPGGGPAALAQVLDYLRDVQVVRDG